MSAITKPRPGRGIVVSGDSGTTGITEKRKRRPLIGEAEKVQRDRN